MDDEKRIIPRNSRIVIAADVPSFDDLTALAKATKGIEGVGGFVINYLLAAQDLGAATGIIRHYVGATIPIILDLPMGPSTPAMIKALVKGLGRAKIAAVILYPFLGSDVQKEWIEVCFASGLQVIAGGMMGNEKFLASKGGYVSEESINWMYVNASRWGVRHFVVPGNKTGWVAQIRAKLTKELGEDGFVLFTRDGDIDECSRMAGNNWHAIVGPTICTRSSWAEMRQAVIDPAG